MIPGRARLLLGTCLCVLASCSSGVSGDESQSSSTDSSGDSSTTADSDPSTSSTGAPTTAPDIATTAPTSAPPATEPELDVAEPACVAEVMPNDSLGLIVDNVGDDAVTIASLQDENRIGDADVIHPGDLLDICVGNDIDDITGLSRLAPDAPVVQQQQQQLNELFEGYGIQELAVDGVSGPLTRQMLCAARMALGLPISATDMPEGSPDHEALMAADSIGVPAGAAVSADRWILIDKSCQVMFVGEGDQGVTYVFATSTGEPGYETKSLQSVSAFRYDPALDNGGWHDSTNFPVSADNSLNGNMYKPIYFNQGQAIHGANYVPPRPESKGCARLTPFSQDTLIEWLGLADVTEATWSRSAIGATVTVQGTFKPEPE